MRVASSSEGVVCEELTPEQAEEKKRESYRDIRAEAEKRFKDRRPTTGRNGNEALIRKYHLTDEEKAKLASEKVALGGVVNPLVNRKGAYSSQVESLIQLGANEFHSLKKVRDKMREIMSAIPKKKRLESGKVIDTDAWTDFYGKESREGASKPKDGDGRIEQNFKVLQRLPREGKEEKNPYGLKLAQFGMCVDIEIREVVPGSFLPFFRLNTTWQPDDEGTVVKPLYVNPNSRRRGRRKAVAADAASTPLPTAAVDTSEVVDSAAVDAVVVAHATAILENSNGQELSVGISAVGTTDEQAEKPMFIPPDDFEEQQKAYEAEKAADEATLVV